MELQFDTFEEKFKSSVKAVLPKIGLTVLKQEQNRALFHLISGKDVFVSLPQWRSQPDNLVPLWKFQTLSLFISLEIDCCSQSMITKNLHSGTKSSGWLRHWSPYGIWKVRNISARTFDCGRNGKARW